MLEARSLQQSLKVQTASSLGCLSENTGAVCVILHADFSDQAGRCLPVADV